MVADHPDQLETRPVGPGPGHQRLADHRVQQMLAGPPGLGQIMLNVTKRHPACDDIQHALVTVVDQQNPFGVRIDGPAARQQLRARHRPHGLIADDQRDLVAIIVQRTQPFQRGRNGGLAHHPIVGVKAALKVTGQCLDGRRVLIDDDDDVRFSG